MGTKRNDKAVDERSKDAVKTTSEDDAQDTAGSAAGKTLIDLDTYKRLYAGMLKCRMVEERVLALLGRRKAATALKRAIGQEAAAVGSLLPLQAEDEVAPCDRSFVAQVISGRLLNSVFQQLLSGREHAKAAELDQTQAAANYVIPAASLEVQAGVATGVALAIRNRNKAGVVVALSGEGWPEPDNLRTTLAFAAANKLPIVYIVNHDENGPLSHDEADGTANLAQSCGVTAITVDGRDAVAVYRVASESISRARKGIGPTIVHCKFIAAPAMAAKRGMRSHKRQSQLDPLIYMESYMRKRNAWSDSWKESLVKRFTHEIDSAARLARRLPPNTRRRARPSGAR